VEDGKHDTMAGTPGRSGFKTGFPRPLQGRRRASDWFQGHFHSLNVLLMLTVAVEWWQ
jgi:hypothetical protein